MHGRRLLTADRRLLNRPRGAATFGIRRLDRIGEALPLILVVQLDAVDDRPAASSGRSATPARCRRTRPRGRSTSRRANPFLRRLAIVAAMVLPFLTLALRRAQGERFPGSSLGLSLSKAELRLVTHFRQLVHLGPVAVRDRRVDDRQIEAQQQTRARRQRNRAVAPRPRPSRAPPRDRSRGRASGRRARTTASCSRGFRSSCRRWSADCGCCFSDGWRWPAKCRRCDRRRASPCARETAARTPTAIRRSDRCPSA